MYTESKEQSSEGKGQSKYEKTKRKLNMGTDGVWRIKLKLTKRKKKKHIFWFVCNFHGLWNVILIKFYSKTNIRKMCRARKHGHKIKYELLQSTPANKIDFRSGTIPSYWRHANRIWWRTMTLINHSKHMPIIKKSRSPFKIYSVVGCGMQFPNTNVYDIVDPWSIS